MPGLARRRRWRSERIGAIREYQIEKSNLKGARNGRRQSRRGEVRERKREEEVRHLRNDDDDDDEEGSNFGNLSNSRREASVS